MMELRKHMLLGGMFAGLLLAAASASAQQVAGAPGATTTIDGRYLPNPPPPFRGEISPNASESKPYWPAHRRAAQGRAECPADHDR